MYSKMAMFALRRRLRRLLHATQGSHSLISAEYVTSNVDG